MPEQTLYQDNKILVTTQRITFGRTTIPTQSIGGVNSDFKIGLLKGGRFVTVISGGRQLEVYRAPVWGSRKAEAVANAINQALFSQR